MVQDVIKVHNVARRGCVPGAIPMASPTDLFASLATASNLSCSAWDIDHS